MPRILDTTPQFEKFARKSFAQGPLLREVLCEEHYHGVFPEVFSAYFARYPKSGVRAVLWELARARKRAEEGGPALRAIIEEVEPKVRAVLGALDVPEPQHVLMIGTMATNAFVGRVGDDVTLFHCLEWFNDPEPTRVLVAHEDTHAWHETILGEPAPGGMAFTAFAEGLAIAVSREVVPGASDYDLFWYGMAGFDDWLGWCRDNREKLLKSFARSLDEEEAVDAFFGGGFVEDKWRTGYFVAAEVIDAVQRPLAELVRLPVEDARQLVRDTLKKLGAAPKPAKVAAKKGAAASGAAAGSGKKAPRPKGSRSR